MYENYFNEEHQIFISGIRKFTPKKSYPKLKSRKMATSFRWKYVRIAIFARIIQAMEVMIETKGSACRILPCQ